MRNISNMAEALAYESTKYEPVPTSEGEGGTKHETGSTTHKSVASRTMFGISVLVNILFVLYYVIEYTSGESLLQGTIQQKESSNNTEEKSGIISTKEPKTEGWVRPDKIYGFVHIAKTGGTEINGELANHFERVCGNKGYSYDALESNKRVIEASKTIQPGESLLEVDLGDAVSKLYDNHNRGRPPDGFMNEVGFDDCDYIAQEIPAEDWSMFSSRWEMELHVPCREPLDHLMSQCNHKGYRFNCTADLLKKEIRKCTVKTYIRMKRILEIDPNITLKCFDPMPPQRYVDYMGKILQRKRIESDYFHRDSNLPRDKDSECIWKQSEEFQEQIRTMLKRIFYYEYCEKCMGTSEELVL